MKMLATLVIAAALGTMGCSSSDQASAGDQAGTDLAQNQVESKTAPATSASASSASNASTKGNMAPDWQLFDVAGTERFSDEFEGKIQIVDFWATWCGPCKIEIPHFIELQNEYKDDLAVIGVALDQVSRVAPFSKAYKINYTNLIGNQKVARDFGVGRSIPTTYVVAQDGTIFKRYVGYRPKAIFEADIQALLAKAER